MANYKNSKMEVTDIHGGVEYVNGQSPDVNDFNKMVEGIGYATEKADEFQSTILYLHTIPVRSISNSKEYNISFLSKIDTPFGYKNTDESLSTDYVFSLPTSDLNPLPIFIYTDTVAQYMVLFHMRTYYNKESIIFIDESGKVISDTIEYVGGAYTPTKF